MAIKTYPNTSEVNPGGAEGGVGSVRRPRKQAGPTTGKCPEIKGTSEPRRVGVARFERQVCKSPNHYKRQCPSNRCFYCHMLGQVKADCNKRKINFIFNRLMEMFEGYIEANKSRHQKNESIKKRMEESRYKKEGAVFML